MEKTHFENLVTSLKEGVTVFYFKKSDGTLRTAVGTLNSELINLELTKLEALKPVTESKPTSGKEAKENPNLLKYYDIVSQGFRSAKIDSIIYLKQVLEDLYSGNPNENSDFLIKNL